ncbi:MAG TPA: acetate--CoA ligase [Solirubrobacteraceae bacterium]|jgi:acetyl-CoA synthetase
MASSDQTSSHDKLAARLEELLQVESFPPPEDFARDALLNDPSVYERAAADPLAWWAQQARELHWFSEWDTTCNDSKAPFYKWFEGGTINASYNCLDRHVEAGLGDRVALHWRGEEGEERDVTYAQLHADVMRFANALRDQGIEQGDVVGIYLPMIPEVVVAMLACSRIGAPHNVVFGGFSPESVKERMEVSEAKALITADGARRKGKVAAVKRSVDEVGIAVDTTIVVRNTGIECPMGEGDVFYDEIMDAASPDCDATALDAEHPLFILYSSGSTAKPKGILHSTGGYLTGAAFTHKYVFDLKPETDVYFCSADVGWITGHTYIVYGPLMNAATSVMYEGAPDYPDKDVWWDLCEHYGVTIFYTAPTAIRACMKWGEQYPGRHDLSKLRLLGTVGEPINPKAWVWYHHVIGGERCPIVDTWWQTETGCIMIAPLPGITHTKAGSATQPLPGVFAAVVDDAGEEIEREQQGLLTLTQPCPSMLRTLYGDDDRYVSTYFEKFGPRTYFVGDASREDADDYFWVIGRVDDVLNVSGHRMSTAEIESAVVSHPKVAECATIGAADEDTGQSVVCFVTLEGDLEGTDELVAEIREHVARKIGKLARPKRIVWADDLPKTRSGKIMRRLLRDIAEGRELGDVTTLRDPDVMAQLESRIAERRDEADA